MYYLKRTIILVVFAVLLFIISACGVGSQSVPAEIVPTPSGAEQESTISSASPASPETECSGGNHLPMYSSFEYFNNQQRFPGFQISEVQEKNGLLYKLENSEIGVIVLIDENEETAWISYNNKKLELQIPDLFSSVDAISLSLSDLTGDGTPELYYAITTGGSGFSETTPIIVNIETMEIVPVEDYVTPMLESLNIELISLEENTATYRIKSTTAEVVQYGSINVLSDLERDYFMYNPDNGTNYASLSNEAGVLSAMVGFTVPGAIPGSYLGYIRGTLTFDTEKYSLKVCPPYVVDIVFPQYFQ